MTSIPQLCVQIADLPPEGMSLEGEVDSALFEPGEDGRFSFPHPLHFRLLVAPVQQGVLVRGRLETTVCAPCDRCLCTVEIAIVVPDACYHFPEMPTGVLDLTEPVREDILFALPQTCLCREDCRGLCPSCGVNRNEETCRCAAPDSETSPWAGLDRLDLP